VHKGARRAGQVLPEGVDILSGSDNMTTMIESFGNRLAEDLFFDRQSKVTRQFPPHLRQSARRKLLYLHDAAELSDLRVPPGNRLEALKGNQWRITFRWNRDGAHGVAVVDYR
jgi:toxin HigB-1